MKKAAAHRTGIRRERIRNVNVGDPDELFTKYEAAEFVGPIPARQFPGERFAEKNFAGGEDTFTYPLRVSPGEIPCIGDKQLSE